jgi:plasmid stabilization system protein ParE
VSHGTHRADTGAVRLAPGAAELRCSVAPIAIRARTLQRRQFTRALLDELHRLANRLLVEDAAHFRVHAESNDVVHVYERADTGGLVGFQFWRTAAMELPGCRAVIGGKLRIDPAFRRRGLHLRSGLRFYLESQLRHPRTRFYRLSLASMFGFVSITSALAEYRLFDPAAADTEGRAIRSAFERLAAQSHYELDPATGLIAVGIRITEATLAHYPESYYERPEARVYARVNPGWRDNGRNVGFWFRFTPANLAKLVRTIWSKR